MVMARVKTIANNSAMYLNPFAKNAVKTAQIHSWRYEEHTRIDPAQRNSDPPRVYISVVNEFSPEMLSVLTLWIRLSQRLPNLVQQWYTAARPQSTLLTDFDLNRLQRSRIW